MRHVASTKHTEPAITFLLWQLNFHLHLETLQLFSVWVIRKGHVSIVKTLKKEEEPQCVKTYLLTCAPNEDSNQPAHPRSLMSLRCSHREFASLARLIWIVSGRSILQVRYKFTYRMANSADPDQLGSAGQELKRYFQNFIDYCDIPLFLRLNAHSLNHCVHSGTLYYWLFYLNSLDRSIPNKRSV